MTQPITQNAYLVANGTGTIYPTVIFARAPTASDLNWPVTQRWIDSSNNNQEFFLLNFSTMSGYYQANWVPLAGGSLTPETLTGNSGGAVGPTAGNINIVGDGTTISVVGDPATSTLTVSTVSGGTVDSVTGTADQILASPTTGNVVLSLVGPYTPATYTAHGVLIGEGTSSIVAVSPTIHTGAVFQNNSGADPTYSTATYPSTTTANQILYSSAANVVGGITTADNGVMISGTTGIPSWLANSGTPGYVLAANSGAPPSWQPLSVLAFALNVQTFTYTGSTQTYTPTSGMSYCVIEVVGGGGGGGGGGAAATAGGGGGGGYSRGFYSAATIGVSKSVTVGAGGAAGTSGSGGTGGTSSVGSGPLLQATGGTGGAASGGAQAAPGVGGVGSSGNIANIAGSGGTFGINTTPNNWSGTGGSSALGGGAAGVGTSTAGSTGGNYGGGGSGATSGNNGGAGAPGVVIITEYIV